MLYALAGCPGMVGGLAEVPLPGNAYIGRYLAADLVAQAQPQLDCAEPRADAQCRDVLRCSLQLQPGLQDEALGEEQLVFCLEAGGQIAMVAHEGGCIHLEPLWRQTLDAQHGIGS